MQAPAKRFAGFALVESMVTVVVVAFGSAVTVKLRGASYLVLSTTFAMVITAWLETFERQTRTTTMDHRTLRLMIWAYYAAA